MKKFKIDEKMKEENSQSLTNLITIDSKIQNYSENISNCQKMEDIEDVNNGRDE